MVTELSTLCYIFTLLVPWFINETRLGNTFVDNSSSEVV